MNDPHTKAREMVVEMEHPEAGTVYGLGIPVKLSATPGSVRRPAPLLGQHTEEILRSSARPVGSRRGECSRERHVGTD